MTVCIYTRDYGTKQLHAQNLTCSLMGCQPQAEDLSPSTLTIAPTTTTITTTTTTNDHNNNNDEPPQSQTRSFIIIRCRNTDAAFIA